MLKSSNKTDVNTTELLISIDAEAFEAAVEASKNFNGKVIVVDSLNAALGERLLGLFALELSKQGLSASEIAEKLNEKKTNIRLFAVIDTLKYLKKGGRISAATAFFGEMLSIKPIIGVIDGKVEVIGKTKGNKKGNQYLISKVDEVGGIDFDMPYGLLYSGNDKTNINKFTDDCEYLFANIIPNSYCLGCTIGTHIGPGAVGIAFFSK
jgi:DegV family protein with EDD domain